MWFVLLACASFTLRTKRTEISASWSMSEQALQGQLIQRSGLQSCWDKQKTDALLGVWHLSFTGASLSGDHSAALQPAWCKSDCAVVPWWVTIPGRSSFKLTSDQRSQAKDALPPQHSTKSLSRSCAGAESSRFSLFHHGYACWKTGTQRAWPVFVTRLRGKGVQSSGRDVMVMSWPSAFPAWVLEWAGAALAPDPVLSCRGCSCRSSSMCTVLVQLIAALRSCLHGKMNQRNYPTVIIPG